MARSSGLSKVLLSGNNRDTTKKGRGRQKIRLKDNIKEWTWLSRNTIIRRSDDHERRIMKSSLVVPKRYQGLLNRRRRRKENADKANLMLECRRLVAVQVGSLALPLTISTPILLGAFISECETWTGAAAPTANARQDSLKLLSSTLGVDPDAKKQSVSSSLITCCGNLHANLMITGNLEL